MSDTVGMTRDELVDVVRHKENIIEALRGTLEASKEHAQEMEDMRNEAVNKAKDLENRCIQLQQMVNGQAAAMAKLMGQG